MSEPCLRVEVPAQSSVYGIGEEQEAMENHNSCLWVGVAIEQ